MDCPNFEQCEGDLKFKVTIEHAGADEWMTFVGYSAECIEQTCECVLTDEQWGALEKAAVEGEGTLIYDD
jgi:hypothetical protein